MSLCIVPTMIHLLTTAQSVLGGKESEQLEGLVRVRFGRHS